MSPIVDMVVAKDVAILFLKIDAVTFRFDPPYTFTSGLKSPVYLDNRIVFSYPKIREKITEYYIDIIKKYIGINNVEWISATATAAIPQGAWIAQKLHLPMVYVRPTTKSYGKGNKIEGYVKKGSKVLIIEDHISSAASVTGNAESIRETGGIVTHCITTTTYESQESTSQLKEHNLNLFALTSGRIIIETAFKQTILSRKEKEIVDLWFQDPLGWAKKTDLTWTRVTRHNH